MSNQNQDPVTAMPSELLIALAMGDSPDQKDAARLRVELKVARSKGTANLLAVIKLFPSLEAFITADNAARDAARNAYRAKEAKPMSEKALLKAAVDPVYLTGCDYVRSAGATLGWEAVQQATTIGGLYAAARAKKGNGKAAKADTMQRDEQPPQDKEIALADSVHNAIVDLAAALESLPTDAAMAILTDAIAAAMAQAMAVPATGTDGQ